jgi:hypothetical protein
LPRASILMNGPQTLTANYKTQYKIMFNQSGTDSDFRGTVVKIDGTNYARSDLPLSFGGTKAPHTFQFLSPLTMSNSRYGPVHASNSNNYSLRHWHDHWQLRHTINEQNRRPKDPQEPNSFFSPNAEHTTRVFAGKRVFKS